MTVNLTSMLPTEIKALDDEIRQLKARLKLLTDVEVPVTIKSTGETIVIPTVAPEARDLRPGIPITEWIGCLIRVARDHRRATLELARYLAYGEQTYNEDIYQYLDMLEYSPGTISNLKTFGRVFTFSRWQELEENGLAELPLTYYQDLCSVPWSSVVSLLTEAREEGYTRADLRKRKRALGYTVPRAPYEIQLENDELASRNGDLQQRLNATEAQLAAATERLEAATAPDAAFARDAGTVVCPFCYKEFEPCSIN